MASDGKMAIGGADLLLPRIRRDDHRLGADAGGLVLCVRERRHGHGLGAGRREMVLSGSCQ